MNGTTGGAPDQKDWAFDPSFVLDALDHAPGGILVCGSDGRWLAVNSTLCRLLGRPREAVLGRLGNEFTHPDDQDATTDCLKELARAGVGGGPHRLEKRYLRPDGMVVPVRLLIQVQRDADGSVLKWVTQVEDLTEQHRAQAGLVRQRAQMQALLDGTEALVFIKDAQFRYQQVNAAFAAVVGLTPEQCRGKTDLELFPAEQAAVYRANDELLLRSGQRHDRLVEVTDAVGGLRTYRSSKTVLLDEAGSFCGIAGVGTDLTREVRGRQALEEANAGLKAARRDAERRNALTDAVLSTLDVGIVACDADGRLTLFNRAVTELHGLDIDSDVDSSGWATAFDLYDEDGVTPLAAEQVPLYRALVDGQVADAVITVAPKGRPSRTLRVDGRAMRDTAGGLLGAVVAMADITEARAAECELARRNELADAANRQRDATATMLDAIVQNSQSLIYVKDLHGSYLMANRPFLDAFSVAEQDLLGRDDVWLDAELAPAWQANDLRARDGAYRVQECSQGQDGRLRWYESVKFPLHDETGALYATCGVSLEVTDLHEQREQAQRADAFSAAVLAATPDTIQVIDLASGQVVYTAGAGGRDGDRQGPLAAAHPQDRRRVEATQVAAGDLEDGQVLQVRYRSRGPHGADRWMLSRMTPFRRGAGGRPSELLHVIRDVTDAVSAEQQLQHAARHDALTGLPNRTLLAERLTEALEQPDGTGQAGGDVAVLFCDLDGFKQVNDSAGHAAGDGVLLQTAQRLQALLRSGDTVARVGGDEFVVVLQPRPAGPPVDGNRRARPRADRTSDHRQGALQVARRIVEQLAGPVLHDGVVHRISVSVGLAFPSPGATAEDALRDADAAMYQAKTRGKDRVEVFDEDLRAHLDERTRVQRVLRNALVVSHSAPDPARVPAPRAEHPALSVAYQSVWDADSSALHGFEALARLTDTAGRAIAPDVFIPIAEEHGLIRTLGSKVLQTACAQLACWRREHPHHQNLTVSVNLSARQAQYPGLVKEVLDALATNALPPDRLVLELTESVLLAAAPGTIEAFRSLREAGVGISIDDFGTGYASLRYLSELPVTAVKIDRSFTAGLPHDATAASIVRAVTGLAADLGLLCVVEGVETQAQRDALPAGVLLQGWLLGRPAPADAASKVLARPALSVSAATPSVLSAASNAS